MEAKDGTANASNQCLAGKVAVVTGAGRNIGRAEALELSRLGAKVLVNDLGGGPNGTDAGDASFAEAVAREIRERGGEAVSDTRNVASFEGGAAVVRHAIDAFGRIDILVNNAGIVRPARIDEMTDEDWTLCLDVSLKASFATIREAAAHMIAQRSGGVIVNTGSPGGFGHWGMSNYSAAKEGLLGLTRTVARELGEFGVRCNLIRPGSQPTTMYTPALVRTVEESNRLGIPVVWNKPVNTSRPDALPEHVAALVAWLCTDAARHVSGRDFYIKGDEVALMPEPDPVRTLFNPGGWTFEALNEPANREYLVGSIQNRFVHLK